MSGDTKDNILYILGIVLVVVPIAKEIISSVKGGKFPTGYIIILLVLAGLIVYMGVEKNGRDSADKGQLSKNIDSLKAIAKTSDSTRTAENKKTAEFLKSLDAKFHIVRDSITNSPVYNINKNVNIQDNHGILTIK